MQTNIFPSSHEELGIKHTFLEQIFKPIVKRMGAAVTFNSNDFPPALFSQTFSFLCPLFLSLGDSGLVD